MAMNAMRLVAIFVWAAVCFLTGCGTLARVGSYGDPSSLHSEFAAFYPATDYDLVAISSGGATGLPGTMPTPFLVGTWHWWFPSTSSISQFLLLLIRCACHGTLWRRSRATKNKPLPRRAPRLRLRSVS